MKDKDEDFFVAYGDDISDVNLHELVRFHKKNKKIACLTTVHPNNQYGIIEFRKEGTSEIERFREKPKMIEWVNGGFYIFRKDIFRYIKPGEELEKEVMSKLIAERQLVAFKHEGYWKSMNTFKEVQELNEQWERGDTPWVKTNSR